jgi:hypothetical protein
MYTESLAFLPIIFIGGCGVISGNGKKNSSEHPFSKKDPKPTRARLVSLLDPLGRKRYGEVERFLATITGATSGLFYYGTQWGWAVRYLLGTKNALCTLHLLPNIFEATVLLGRECDEILKNATTMSPDLKRRIARCTIQSGTRAVRIPIKNDADYGSFQMLIQIKAEGLRNKKPPKPKKEALPKETKKSALPAAKVAKKSIVTSVKKISGLKAKR